ncbi:hypothetical protein PP298_04500 [Mycobacteroides abscessus]|uniref:hypothetical protein n=1 Tax=Mycobacteroides abscessus TaxID=36809 RepID=UPI00078BE638|nr:hypothetical protein [Mycobacteroides abscessus]AMU69568.1 hypothetical protein A3O05_05515 [Mycobacteroides abscessus]MDM2014600.1 hypothetical protein [Mycobacteroides abscessus]MDM2020241.1 hypothetical protein [Mycobacteroides abscessus]MDM2023887.1 hypothetical protein [Mycobacteroides abscessus]MDM2028842.1 hypothetical protein [Mycobacteroides abscessus]
MTSQIKTTDDRSDVGQDLQEKDSAEQFPDEHQDQQEPSAGRWRLRDVLVFWVIPVGIIGLAAGAGYLKWRDAALQAVQEASTGAVSAATDSTVKMLSYKPDTVQKDLELASDQLAGPFRDSYNALIHDVVVPGAKQKQISAVATVPAAALVSSTPEKAVVMVFVNQTTIIGGGAPTATASTVRVTLDKVGKRWLICDFTPI